MRLFRNSVALETEDLHAMVAYQGAVAPTRFYAASETPVRARVSQVRRAGVSFFSADVQGPLVREALNWGTDAGLGLVLAGQVRFATLDRTIIAGPGEAVWTFPGDFVAQGSKHMVVATVRTPIGREEWFRLRALPYSARQGLARCASWSETAHLARLLMFFSSECERIGDDATDLASVHLDGLANAIADLVRSMMPLPDALRVRSDPEALRVCLAADAVLHENPLSSVPARALADRAACSERHLYRSFDRIVGISPQAYALRSRLVAVRNSMILGPIAGSATYGYQLAERLIRETRFRSRYREEFGEYPAQTRERCSRLTADALRAVFGRCEDLVRAP